MSALPIRLFSPDLDGTLLGNPEAAWRFTERWSALDRGRRPLLAYNTGRTIADTQALVATGHLPEPDFIIGSVGTELHDSLYNRSAEYRAQFGEGWDLPLIDAIVGAVPGIRRQPAESSRAFKSSWHWVRAPRTELENLEARLRCDRLQVLVIYSCRYFLDIVPARAGKGNALAWLCQRLSISLSNVLVAGDTANDTTMFLLPGVRGIVVENALPELLAATVKSSIFVARQPMADGVLEGLTHYGVLAGATANSRPAEALPA
jgi:sucrose-6F-phosphate phosphohydrolase